LAAQPVLRTGRAVVADQRGNGGILFRTVDSLNSIRHTANEGGNAVSLRSCEKIKLQAEGLLHKVGKCIGIVVE
jgi:hypothetical protein